MIAKQTYILLTITYLSCQCLFTKTSDNSPWQKASPLSSGIVLQGETNDAVKTIRNPHVLQIIGEYACTFKQLYTLRNCHIPHNDTLHRTYLDSLPNQSFNTAITAVKIQMSADREKSLVLSTPISGQEFSFKIRAKDESVLTACVWNRRPLIPYSEGELHHYDGGSIIILRDEGEDTTFRYIDLKLKTVSNKKELRVLGFFPQKTGRADS